MSQRRRAPILALLSAYAISLLGTNATLVAVPWYVLVTTGSPAATGLVGFFVLLSEVLSGLLGGAVVDRVGHRRASIATDLGSAVALACVPLLHAATGLAYWQLVVLVSLRSLGDAPGNAARMSMLPELARLGEVSLERANSAIQTIVRASVLLGAPLAGFLIALTGPANVLWVDAATYVCSALLVTLCVPAGTVAHGRTASAGYRQDLLDGFRYVVRDALLASIVMTVAVTNFLDAPLSGVILPVAARRDFGSPVALGVLLGTLAGGGVAGALLYAVFAPRLPRRPTYLVAWLVAGGGLAAFALAPTLPGKAAALWVMGMGSGPINPIIGTVLQERVPAAMRARVFGSARALAFAATPLGVLAGGLALQAFSVRDVLFLIAGLYVLVTLSMWLNPAYRRLDSPAYEGRVSDQ